LKKISDWKFENIATEFDSHVREQLPWYDLVIDSIAFIVKNYIPKNGKIYDIGGSTGNVKKLLIETISDRNLDYYILDNVSEMNPDILGDAVEYDYQPFDCAILNLTLMFIPVKHRRELLLSLYDKLNVGGCIIIVDKFIQNESYISTIFRRMTINWKFNNGVSCDSIVEKELSLSGIQIPLYHTDIEYYRAQKFFQFGEFSGYVISK
jgi:tRNA (cmo5U34)-methyltransferase